MFLELAVLGGPNRCTLVHGLGVLRVRDGVSAGCFCDSGRRCVRSGAVLYFVCAVADAVAHAAGSGAAITEEQGQRALCLIRSDPNRASDALTFDGDGELIAVVDAHLFGIAGANED